MLNRLFIALILITGMALSAVPVCNAQTLQTGISIEERVPNSFMGTWRVTSHLIGSGASPIFKLSGVDLWNLSRSGNVINLNNPFTGASASITVNYADGKTVKFNKCSKYDNKILTDTVEIKLSDNQFTGVNTLRLDTLSDVNQAVIKTETAKYSLYGEKISGMSIEGK